MTLIYYTKPIEYTFVGAIKKRTCVCVYTQLYSILQKKSIISHTKRNVFAWVTSLFCVKILPL